MKKIGVLTGGVDCPSLNSVIRAVGLVFLLVYGHCSYADKIVLKTGEIYEGIVLEKNDKYVSIATGGAPLYLSLENIDHVEANSVAQNDGSKKNSVVDNTAPLKSARSDDSQGTHALSQYSNASGEVVNFTTKNEVSLVDFNSSEFHQRVEKAYQTCVEQTAKGFLEDNKGKVPAKYEKSINAFAVPGAEESCKIVRSACFDNINSVSGKKLCLSTLKSLE